MPRVSAIIFAINGFKNLYKHLYLIGDYNAPAGNSSDFEPTSNLIAYVLKWREYCYI